MTLTETRGRIVKSILPDTDLISHNAWAQNFSVGRGIPCLKGDIEEAVRTEGAKVTPLLPLAHSGQHIHNATPVRDFPKIIEGLSHIQNADGSPKYPWARNAKKSGKGIVVKINSSRMFEYWPDRSMRSFPRQIFPTPK